MSSINSSNAFEDFGGLMVASLADQPTWGLGYNTGAEKKHNKSHRKQDKDQKNTLKQSLGAGFIKKTKC